MKAKAFIESLPKAELHLHFEGTLPWELIRAHRAEPLPNRPPWWGDGFLFDNFAHFSQALGLCFRQTLTSVEIYHQAARTIFKNLAAQNVRYVETSFSPEHAIGQRLPLTEVVSAIKEAAPAGLTVSVFCGLGRQKPRPLTDPVIEEIIMRDKWNSASTILSKVEVKVNDPQGFSDIDGVFLEVKN